MANSRIKKPDAEKSKAFLSDIVKSYYLKSEEEIAQHRNKGALKYLKDTMVSAVVLSPNPVKRMRKESFLNYFMQFVLPSDYDTLISYTDTEQNLKAFLDCAYFWGDGESEGRILTRGLEASGGISAAQSEEILIPFLLLQDLQRAVEQNFDIYLRQKVLSPYDDSERSDRDESNDAAKEEKYMHMVYTLQYYEIFMEEFRRRIMDRAGQPQDEEKFQKIQKLTEEFTSCTDKYEKIILGKRLLDITQEGMAVLGRMYMASLYPVLYMHHFINLMAMLRILFIAEYVNINHGFTEGLADKDKHRRRLNIELMVSEKLLEFDLFFFRYRENPNLTRIFKELTVTAEKSNIIPDLGNQEEMNEFHSDLEAYIKQIRKTKAGERDAAAEEMLMKSRITLAKPFLCKLSELNMERQEV